MEIPKIVVIGGGASGALFAIQLVRKAQHPVSVTVLEPRQKLGRGLAYSALSTVQLLNVPASDMSALPDQPSHFLDWLTRRERSVLPGYTFAPRVLYGDYIEETLRTATQRLVEGVTIDHVADRALGIKPGTRGFEVLTEKSGQVGASSIVLALGNGVPGNLPGIASDVNIVNPWSADAFRPETAGVVLVGSGLTAVDVCLALAEAGQTGPIYLVSRHGLLPRSHLETPLPPKPGAFTAEGSSSVCLLLREIRRAARRDMAEGGSWHRVVDSVRSSTNQIWQALPLGDKRRFLRHARSYWEVFRHRMPAQVSKQIENMRRIGQLQIIRGRVSGATKYPDGQISVRVHSGNVAPEILIRAGRIVNCTGPQNDPRKWSNPLVRQIIADGIARPDPLHLGLETTNEGALIRADGTVWQHIFALGPTRKGTLWETTAMPEIRHQAADLALGLLQQSARDCRTT
jgi:uncharacterized NAD(P)/FAD-binding protein YdhS